MELLERAVVALGPELLSEVVFVGAATLPLWITDRGAPPPRPTNDVDVVVEITARIEYAEFEQRLRRMGFRDDGHVICRWHHDDTELVLDAMPTDASILGFENRWQRHAASVARQVTLPSGAAISVIDAAGLMATKLEAFATRGKADVFGSKDFEDIVALVDGRPELVEDIRNADPEMREHIVLATRSLLDHPRFSEGVEGALGYGAASYDRAAQVVEPRLRALADAG